MKTAHLLGEKRVLDCGLQEKAMSWMWVKVRSVYGSEYCKRKKITISWLFFNTRHLPTKNHLGSSVSRFQLGALWLLLLLAIQYSLVVLRGGCATCKVRIIHRFPFGREPSMLFSGHAAIPPSADTCQNHQGCLGQLRVCVCV